MATALFPNHTVEEFDIHVLRALGTDTHNYRRKGDVSLNSPGNLDLAVVNANKFMLSPTAELTNPAVFKLGYQTEPATMKKTLDAAYIAALLRYAAAKGTPINATHVAISFTAAQYAAQVKAIVLAQVARPETDFTKYDYFNDTSGWVLAGFVYKLIGAAQLIWDDFSTSEKAIINTWIGNVGVFYSVNVHLGLRKLFPNRLTGDYKPAGDAASGALNDPTERNPYTHVDASGVAHNRINRTGANYNNRRASMAALISKIACHFKFYKIAAPIVEVPDKVGTGKTYSTLERHAKCFFKEFIDYGVFPDGMQAEMERCNKENPNKGFSYAADNLDAVIRIACNFGRLGDTECLDYESYLGILATKGGPKSLKSALVTYYEICNGTREYYYSLVAPVNRIRLNGVVADGKTLFYVSDTRFVEANLYYKLPMVTETYTRNPARFNSPYPSGAANNLIGSIGGQPPFSSFEQTMPVGNLFLFGQMENRVNPFAVSKIKQTITFPEVASKTFGDAPVTLGAFAGSGLAVSYSLISGSATLVGSVLTLDGAGEMKVRASQAGNGTYEAAPDVEQVITVEKASQEITFSSIADKQYSVDGPFALVASSSVGLPITFDIESGIGSIAGSIYTPNGVGAVTLVARQDGNDNYKSATAKQSFKVTPAPAPVTTNILLGKSYVLSSNGSPVPAKAFTNGLEEKSLAPTEFYATFDFDQLGNGNMANKIVVKFKTPMAKFKMQYWDGLAWVDWVTSTGNKLKEVVFPIANKLLNMKIRFVGIGKSPEYNVSELEIWAYKS